MNDLKKKVFTSLRFSPTLIRSPKKKLFSFLPPVFISPRLGCNLIFWGISCCWDDSQHYFPLLWPLSPPPRRTSVCIKNECCVYMCKVKGDACVCVCLYVAQACVCDAGMLCACTCSTSTASVCMRGPHLILCNPYPRQWPVGL